MDNSPLRGQTADLVVVDEVQDFQVDREIDVSAMLLPDAKEKPSKVKREVMFSLSRYMVKKAQVRLDKATFRQAKRDARVPKK